MANEPLRIIGWIADNIKAQFPVIGPILGFSLAVFGSVAAGRNKAVQLYFVEEVLTLTNGGTNHDSVGNLLPANGLIGVVHGTLLDTITGTSWTLADTVTAARFASANTTLTALASSVGLNHWKGGVNADAAGPTQATAAKVRVTTIASPGASKRIRLQVLGLVFNPPTS